MLVEPLRREPAANVVDSESCKGAQNFVRVAVLRSDPHQCFPRLRFRVPGLARRFRRHLRGHYRFRERTGCNSAPGYTYKSPTIHFQSSSPWRLTTCFDVLFFVESLWCAFRDEAI